MEIYDYKEGEMKKEKLELLLKDEILPDLEVAIDELFDEIGKSDSASPEQQDDLEELRDMRSECFAILEELNRGEIEEDEIEALYNELIGLKSGELE